MRYVYYNKITGQVEGTFNSPNLPTRPNAWTGRGLTLAINPDDIGVTRDHKVDEVSLIDGEEYIANYSVSINPVQEASAEATPLSELMAQGPTADKAALLTLLHEKLAATSDLSSQEMNRMLALERES